MFDESAEESLMSPLAGKNHMNASLAIVKLSQLLIIILMGMDSFPDKRIQRAKLLKAFIKTHK